MCLRASSQAEQTASSRIFPARKQFDAEALRQLGEAMSFAPSAGSGIPSGYVYLGQFIAHDLSRLPRPFSEPNTPPAPPYKPLLDLDGIYGDEPHFNKTWVDQKTGRMRLRRGPTGKPVDLPRNDAGKAVIGDDRNDENLILAQLHLQFLELHNFFVDRIAARTSLQPPQVFEAARQELIQHYQQVVFYDFLDTVLDPRVWQYVIWEHMNADNKKLLPDPEPDAPALLPLEFSAAAFRFGHSMIRKDYQLTDQQPAKLEDLFEMTHAGALKPSPCGGPAPLLPQTHVIEWKHFFPGLDASRDPLNRTRPNMGMAIDVASSIEVTDRFSGGPATSDSRDQKLVVKNLLTGNLAGLPSGQEVIQHLQDNHAELINELRIKPLEPQQVNPSVWLYIPHQIDGRMGRRIEYKPIFEHITVHHDFAHRTPLWYYLLAEANARHRGQRLGPLGSLIVAESLRAMARQTAPCVLDRDQFESKYIIGTKDIHGRQFLRMSDLLQAVASSQSTNP